MKRRKLIILFACFTNLMMLQVVYGKKIDTPMGYYAKIKHKTDDKSTRAPINQMYSKGLYINSYLRRGATGEFPSSDSGRPRTDFVDVASYQSWMSQEDFYVLRRFGVRGVVVKLTEGTYYRNPYARQQIDYARRAGLQISVYHFSKFNSDESARSEANFFVNFAKELALDGNTVMVNDAEDSSMFGGVVDATFTSKVFEQQLKDSGYSRCVHYTCASKTWNGDLRPADLGFNNMWIAQYPDNPLASNLLHIDMAAWQWGQVRFAGLSLDKGIDVNVDYTGVFTGSAGARSVEDGIPVYRVLNPTDKRHLFTINRNEMINLVQNHGWIDEGIAFYFVNEKQGIPLYRLYNKNSGEHFYTINEFERDDLIKKGWADEGIAGYVLHPDGNVGIRILRLWNSDPDRQEHLFTANTFEYEEVPIKHLSWKSEDEAFRVLKL
ncbi:MAG: hypothetical protein LBS28_01725 [Streptococcaceae bacterium]|jgi:GH25 family lysozyme M1 (1,4-beta-N-acetylmuramidase)|nr:hypothetical protein [Streptococcaceae bacterium]